MPLFFNQDELSGKKDAGNNPGVLKVKEFFNSFKPN